MSEIYRMRHDVDIEHQIIDKWQRILDLLSETLSIPVALIRRVHSDRMEVFAKSSNPENSFYIGETAWLKTGLYCKAVMETRQELIVSNAVTDENWKSNTDASKGFIAYMGFPIIWPTGELFGTICVLDRKETHFSDLHKRLLGEFSQIGGVAHEINNPINGIINYAELISEDPSADEHIRAYSAGIKQEGRRIAEIVKNLLSFARHEKQTHSPAQISDIINQTISLIRTVMRHDQIALEINVPEGLPNIKCRSQQIQQVLMNLITNARDALNQRYKNFDEDKKIILNCSMFEKDDRRWFKITVEDHGNGIPEEILDRVFDPFFTTKPREEGTGLGLSISHGIVKDHHGELYFETEPGVFTRAVLILPVDNGWTL